MSSRKHKTILTPHSPLWTTFRAHLAQGLRIEGSGDVEPICSHKATMPATYQALLSVGLAQRNVLATRQFFRDCGLHCDCAVWHNPDALLGSTPEEGDEEAPFDANAYYWSEIRPQEEAAGLHGGERHA